MRNYILLSVILQTLHAYQICTETKCSMKADQYICPNANLTYIPIAAINAELIDLSGNYLPQIEQDDLADFKHLTVLTLSNVSLKLIHRNAFKKLKFLEKLDLSMNLLKFLYPDTFSDTIIQHLNLSGNIFRRLVNNQFAMPHLQQLDLSNGFLENIHKEAFASSNSLRWVNLSVNKLTTLQISEILLSCPRLDYLILNNNTWSCDCDFYMMSKTPIVYQNSIGLRCELDKEYIIYANSTSFLELTCVDYLNKTYEQIAARNLEKSTRGDNSTNMIVNVYGYVLIGFTILIIFCCCCKRKTAKNDIDESTKPPPVKDKIRKPEEKNVEQVHTFEKCKVEFHHEDNFDLNKISVRDK
ncbi:SLIT and NTRK-like protein 5 [Planococcus citri]|uniref:SLIT and NTRK-like protein 5 n=1 Tax=Planococcus citri TaxID=170843 RepID=UPI0031F8102F